MSSINRMTIAVAAAALALGALPAAAQPPQPPQRGYVVGLGGLGATQVNSPLFGASAGFNVTPDLQITIEAGRMDDVQAPFTRDDLAALDAFVTTQAQASGATAVLPFVTSVKMPTNYLTGGVRFLLPVRGNFRPYVMGSGGIAHMSPSMTIKAAGLDITSGLLNDAVVGPLFTKTFREETRPMASVGGGIEITVARHLTFDAGYRYSGIFIHTDYLQANGIDASLSSHNHTILNTHRVFGGVGVAF